MLELQHSGAEVQGAMTGVDGQVSRLQGSFDGAKATGTISMAGTTGWFAAGFLGDGLTLLVAEIDPQTGQPNLDDGWRLDFARAGGAQPQAPAAAVPGAGGGGAAGGRGDAAATTTPLTQEWLQHLRGKKVTFMERYSSNDARGFGGYSNQWEAYLCSDMSFHFERSGSLSLDTGGAIALGQGQNAFSGTWRIIEHGGQAILQDQRRELAGTDQGEWVALSHRNGQTFFDNSRVYVTSDNHLCR